MSGFGIGAFFALVLIGFHWLTNNWDICPACRREGPITCTQKGCPRK